MSSKTISLPEPVYERLSEQKREGESFGDVIERLLGGSDLEPFWGAWSDETVAATRETIAEGREESDERLSRLVE